MKRFFTIKRPTLKQKDLIKSSIKTSLELSYIYLTSKMLELDNEYEGNFYINQI